MDNIYRLHKEWGVRVKSEISFMRIIVVAVTLITLILTPWVNSDSLTIPKIIILFLTGMFFLPQVLFNFRHYLRNMWLKILFFLALIFLIQMIIAICLSSAPFEQQLYGRTGRGLGFITFFSLIVILLAVALFTSINQIRIILFGAIFSTILSSIYAIFQKFGLDIFEWYTRTNGIIGTLGNPNFQSSIAAFALVPSIFYLKSNSKRYLFNSFLFGSILLAVIYFSQSTQGYISVVLAIFIYLIMISYYRSKSLFKVLSSLFSIVIVCIILGMANQGPLADYLYKYSVKSRAEMWRTAIASANDNPFFGVGLDSFADWSRFYISASDAKGVNEFIDSAHNYFLDLATFGGYPLALTYFLIIILTLASFLDIFRKNEFNKEIVSLFCMWMVLQAQSLISPINIVLMTWSFLICGEVIGVASKGSIKGLKQESFQFQKSDFSRPFSIFLVFFSLLITYPYFNVDRMQLNSLNTRDANLAIESAKAFPESVVRYQRIGLELLNSGLLDQSLDIARSSVEFNPNAISGWALILANEKAPLTEKIKAQTEILRMDPFNYEIRELKLTAP